ncbi:MAG: GtrA family protein [Bacteroidia bacterium]|nr:GtrA family protein [Bacteroidia bacterium]
MGIYWLIVKFCVVGFSGTFVDFGTTWLLKEKAKIYKYLANSTGFALGAVSNYFLNRIWTFHSENPHVFNEFSKFFTVSMFGLLINNSVIWLLHGRFKLNFYLAKVFAIGVTLIWNFTVNYFYTFHRTI